MDDGSVQRGPQGGASRTTGTDRAVRCMPVAYSDSMLQWSTTCHAATNYGMIWAQGEGKFGVLLHVYSFTARERPCNYLGSVGTECDEHSEARHGDTPGPGKSVVPLQSPYTRNVMNLIGLVVRADLCRILQYGGGAVDSVERACRW